MRICPMNRRKSAMHSINFRIDTELLEKVDEECAKLSMSRTMFMKEILAEYMFREKGYKVQNDNDDEE